MDPADGQLVHAVSAEAMQLWLCLRDEEARARGPGGDQTSYRFVIDAGHNEGTSLRDDAGYDEKC